jgi:hypothetical protein
MTREERLREDYENKLRELHIEQNMCIHEWEDPKYDPEIKLIPQYTDRWVGVDYMPAICGFSEKKIDRWSRTCKKCGKVEYTKEQVVIRTAPKFN